MDIDPMAGDFPLKDFLGMEMADPGTGTGLATAEVTVGAAHLNPHGFLHGAVLFAMVDTAIGRAVMSVLPEGQRCATVEASLRFLRPVNGGRLRAEASVTKQGRSLVHAEARVHDGDGRLVATSAATFAVIAV